MKTFIAGLAFTAALITPAYADWQYKYGAWVNDFYAKNSAGKSMCTASVYGKDRSFALKTDGQALWIHVSKNSWNFRAGIKTKISLNVDNAPGIDMAAETVKATNGASMIESTFDLDQVSNTGKNLTAEFLEELQEGNELSIGFPGGSENDWSADLNGSRAAIHTFWNCMKNELGGNHNTSPVDRNTSPVDKDM